MDLPSFLTENLDWIWSNPQCDPELGSDTILGRRLIAQSGCQESPIAVGFAEIGQVIDANTDAVPSLDPGKSVDELPFFQIIWQRHSPFFFLPLLFFDSISVYNLNLSNHFCQEFRYVKKNY